MVCNELYGPGPNLECVSLVVCQKHLLPAFHLGESGREGEACMPAPWGNAPALAEEYGGMWRGSLAAMQQTGVVIQPREP